VQMPLVKPVNQVLMTRSAGSSRRRGLWRVTGFFPGHPPIMLNGRRLAIGRKPQKRDEIRARIRRPQSRR
jgi:hypothetical protein